MVNLLSRVALVATIATTTVNAVPVVNGPFDMLDDLPFRAKGSVEYHNPPNCISSYPDHFELTVVDLDLKNRRQVGPNAQVLPRSLEKRSCNGPSSLTVGLHNGVLTDTQGRTGCIVANFQFQFDGPPQHGTIFADGWSACNGSLALHGQTVFYKCPSGRGNGEVFYNLYDRKWTEHCKPHLLNILPCNGDWEYPPGRYPPPPPAPEYYPEQYPGQYQPGPPPPITQIIDGQLQAPNSPPAPRVGPPAPRITVISDGQPQAPGNGPLPNSGDRRPSPGHAPPPPGPQASSHPNYHSSVSPKPPRISVHPNGQVQAPHHRRDAPITQIGDGQIQGGMPDHRKPDHRGPPVTQIGDGQIQGGNGQGGSSGQGRQGGQENGQWGGYMQGGHNGQGGSPPYRGPPITQIGDGQIQGGMPDQRKPDYRGPPIIQIGDGQVQGGMPDQRKPDYRGPPIIQIGDGQVQGGMLGGEGRGYPHGGPPRSPPTGGQCYGPPPPGGFGGNYPGGQGRHGEDNGPPVYTITQIGDGQIQAGGKTIIIGQPQPTPQAPGRNSGATKTIIFDTSNCPYPYGGNCGPAPTPMYQPYPPQRGPGGGGNGGNGAPVTQIGDGQIQGGFPPPRAPLPPPPHRGPPVGQIPDGQLQASHHFHEPISPYGSRINLGPQSTPSAGRAAAMETSPAKRSLAVTAQVPFIMGGVLGLLVVLFL